MTQDFGHGACRIGGWKVETGGAVGRDQDTRGSFQPRTFHRAGIGQFRENTLKPLGGSIVGNGHNNPLG